jgi:hypothetical protein
MRYEEYIIIGGSNGLKDKVGSLSLKNGNVVRRIEKPKGDMAIIVTHENCLYALTDELRGVFGQDKVIHQVGGEV